MDKTDYEDKIMQQLTDIQTYTSKESDDTIEIKQEADKLILNLFENNILSFKQKKNLTNFCPKCPTFYGIPKVHKEGIPLRPIVSQIDGPTSRINKLVDYYLTTAEKQIPDLLQDTTAYLNILNKYNQKIAINSDTYLVTLDVVSLYTNIPHEEGADFVCEFYEETLPYCTGLNMPLIPAAELKKMILFILKNCTFTFNKQFYTQNYGTTMGAIFSVKFANIYMHMFFRKFFQTHTNYKLPFLARLVDDIFTIWNEDFAKLQEFRQILNTFHNTIKFELKYSNTEIQFLDTVTYIEDNSLKTKLFIKPTDNKQYLHFYSSHPNHIKRSIPYSQALRYRRIITDNNILHSELKNLKTKFLTRGYPHQIVDKQIDKVVSINRKNTLQYKSISEKNADFLKFTKGGSFLPLILTYHPTLLINKIHNIHALVNNNWHNLLVQHETLQKAFGTSVPKIIFKRGKTIANHLISSTYPPLWHRYFSTMDQQNINILAQLLSENQSDTYHKVLPCFHPRCLCCSAIQQDNTFFSTKTKNTHLITSNMNCNTTNVIYLITCLKCGLQYVGQSGRKLKDRLNNHRSDVHNKKLTAISIHFRSALHNINHLKIIPIEESSHNSEYRISREKYWIKTLQTFYPHGLNNYPINYKYT